MNTNTCNLFLDDYDNSDDPNRNINSKLSRQTIILEFALVNIRKWAHMCGKRQQLHNVYR